MKYVIELTDNQKGQMDLLIEMAHKHVGFTPKLERLIPLPMEESPAYNKGFDDGKKWAIDENAKDHQGYYNKGLEDGYKGYKYLDQWFCDSCFYEDEDKLFPEYKRRQADTCCLEDIITDVGFSEVLKRVKAYEEKKKPDGEIKVGDIVYYGEEMFKAVVLDIVIEQGVTYAVMLDENGLNVNEELSGLKYIEHTNEVEQLLNRLKGE